MKTKRLVIILSVLIFLTLIIVLMSAVFTVRSIDVKWYTEPNVLTIANNEGIVDSSNIKMKSSVFTVNKKECTSRIEKAYSYIKVERVEIAFPNKVLIHVSEREPYFYLNMGDDYAILDQEMKVLELTTNLTEYSNKFGITPVELNIDSTMYANITVDRGDFLDIACTDSVVGMTSFLKTISYTPIRAKNTLKTIRISNNDMYIYTDLGLNIYINDMNTKYNDKLLKGFSAYEQYKDNLFSGTVLCYTDNTYIVPEHIDTF